MKPWAEGYGGVGGANHLWPEAVLAAALEEVCVGRMWQRGPGELSYARAVFVERALRAGRTHGDGCRDLIAVAEQHGDCLLLPGVNAPLRSLAQCSPKEKP